MGVKLCRSVLGTTQRSTYLWCKHVDECVANVALVLEVNGQVEEVKGAFELLLNRLHTQCKDSNMPTL